MERDVTVAVGWDRISVCVITLNEEENLARCLSSVVPCGEIVVVDSGSSDGTRGVADRFGAKWLSHPWAGFAAQRTHAAEAAQLPWVLFLDADEWLGPELRDEVGRAVASDDASALWQFRRESRFLGRTIRHGDWSKDYVSRLAPRGRWVWRGTEPHPRLEAPGLPRRCFRHPLKHTPYRDLATFQKKIESYARTWADEASRSGAQGSPLVGRLRASWRFLRGYFLRGGFLDGRPGWVIAMQNARMVYLKHLFLSRDRA